MSASTFAKPQAAELSEPHPSLIIYSTLSKRKEPFRTVRPGKVGVYLCGPTVYDKAHIGHMVGPVIFDSIKRYLKYCGYNVTWVVNITDVDDKLINKANERGISMFEVAEENIADYHANLSALGVDQVDHFPRATECMDEIIEITQRLIDRGFAYASGGDVYFDVTKDPQYGKLSNRTLDAIQGDGGGAVERKRSPADFALWKSAKPGEPAWDSSWGKGRPGWHIECSAMSRKLLGETFDIHGGGLDLVFPHHENEIAQSECGHGKTFATYWAHNGLLRAAKLSFTATIPQTSQEPVARRVDEILSKPKWSIATANGKSVVLDRKTGIGVLQVAGDQLNVVLNLRFEGEVEPVDVLKDLGLSDLAGSATQQGPAGKIGGRSEREAAPAVRAEDAGKMSRSKGAGGLADLIQRQGGERIRFFLLRTHYRSTVVFSEPAIEEASNGLETFYRLFKRFHRIVPTSDFYHLQARAHRADDSSRPTGNPALDAAAECKRRFIAAMDDDFNTGGAIGELFELAKITNRYCDEKNLEGGGADNATMGDLTLLMATIKELSSILGIFLKLPVIAAQAGGAADAETLGKVMQLVIELRAEARKAKNFAMADAIRDGLAPTGIKLEDRAGGTEWSGGGAGALEAVVQLLIDVRQTARKNKDFATSDAIRDRLAAAGVKLEDRGGGTDWVR